MEGLNGREPIGCLIDFLTLQEDYVANFEKKWYPHVTLYSRDYRKIRLSYELPNLSD
jgi:hypothetical protein